MIGSNATAIYSGGLQMSGFCLVVELTLEGSVTKRALLWTYSMARFNGFLKHFVGSLLVCKGQVTEGGGQDRHLHKIS